MQFVIFRGDSTSLRRRDCKKGLSFNNIYSEEQGMAQCWDNSPPTIVAQVQIPASTPYVGWSSLLLVLSLVPRGFSPGSPVRPLSLKPTLPTDTFKRVHKNSRVLRNKLLFTKFFFFFFLYFDVSHCIFTQLFFPRVFIVLKKFVSFQFTLITAFEQKLSVVPKPTKKPFKGGPSSKITNTSCDTIRLKLTSSCWKNRWKRIFRSQADILRFEVNCGTSSCSDMIVERKYVWASQASYFSYENIWTHNWPALWWPTIIKSFLCINVRSQCHFLSE